MKTRQEWMAAYATTHQHPINKWIHLVFVPLIMFSIFGLLWQLRVPSYLWGSSSWLLNAAWPAAFIALAFYARLGVQPFLYLSATVAFMLSLIALLEIAAGAGFLFYAVVFTVGWIAQFYGHYVEGKKPSFFEDLQFLLIGPLWLFYR